jgi:hypothetical protein
MNRPKRNHGRVCTIHPNPIPKTAPVLPAMPQIAKKHHEGWSFSSTYNGEAEMRRVGKCQTELNPTKTTPLAGASISRCRHFRLAQPKPPNRTRSMVGAAALRT